MSKRNLKAKVTQNTWKQCAARQKSEETVATLHGLFDCIVEGLAPRIDDIKTDDGKSISFFSEGREILTINVTRKDLRIYIHPAARTLFDPKSEFKVERFGFWEASYQKSSGKYRGMSF
jgi:hypothetical protein